MKNFFEEVMTSVGQKFLAIEDQIKDQVKPDLQPDSSEKIKELERKFKGLVSAVKKEIQEIDRNTQ